MIDKIQTTVVGSYPVPAWLAGVPSEQSLADATRVVLHTQEQAGIDLVWDGEIRALVAGWDLFEGRQKRRKAL
jgi:methionine synthase II (cobalamin-independent)